MQKLALLCLVGLLAFGCGQTATDSAADAQRDGSSVGSAELCDVPALRGELATRAAAEAVSATFSIVAIDPESGICGAAVASKYPAVGKVVPYARGGVGAFCTQHYHNPDFGPRALEMLAEEKSAEEVLAELLKDDPRRETRQLAIIDRRGNTAQHNPVDAPARSRWWGAASGRYYACQGNTLVSRQVISAMAGAYETTEGSLADRLMAALMAGDTAGGDHRGRLAAGIIVARPGVDGHWLDLQVDESDDAVTELMQKYIELEHDAKQQPPAGLDPLKNADKPELQQAAP